MTAVTADAILTRLTRACVAAGLEAEIIEPNTKIRISKPGAHPRLAEIITLKPGPDDAMCFWWSWNAPCGSADDVGAAVQKISGVVTPPQI